MKFFTLATIALVATVDATELQNQAHAKGLKAPHPVRLAQDKGEENRDWAALAGRAAAAADNALNNAEVSSKSKRDWGALAGQAAAAANNALNNAEVSSKKGLAQTKSKAAIKTKAHAKNKAHAKGHEKRDWRALAGQAAAAANSALNG